jgi:hypothetical protein
MVLTVLTVLTGDAPVARVARGGGEASSLAARSLLSTLTRRSAKPKWQRLRRVPCTQTSLISTPCTHPAPISSAAIMHVPDPQHAFTRPHSAARLPIPPSPPSPPPPTLPTAYVPFETSSWNPILVLSPSSLRAPTPTPTPTPTPAPAPGCVAAAAAWSRRESALRRLIEYASRRFMAATATSGSSAALKMKGLSALRRSKNRWSRRDQAHTPNMRPCRCSRSTNLRER